MEGVLCKWTNPIEGWRYLFFVLDDVVGKLHYFTSKQKLLRGERRGSVTLRRARVLRDEIDTSAFSIAVDRKRLYFQARDPNEREAWVEALQSAIVEQSISQNDSDDDPDPKEQCTSSFITFTNSRCDKYKRRSRLRRVLGWASRVLGPVEGRVDWFDRRPTLLPPPPSVSYRHTLDSSCVNGRSSS
ncbi:unnamed protein product [Timema podura]|uniref:PH domain-containing protein n=1 Tax=Timema podura TaxID=61482 RepID=A0ABN7PJX4_TIMPD|nr:unnamed protein product [Timema podura]